ncbi:SRPBCC family protein [Paenibacillus alba]|uniref:SRPBCC domain-containing protein n=1 Tax=Paenibacillus alba TaxID=1197127 RepID=A0ABU6GC53_9BACL|nr:SRPBCC domain-containing protein [Paenibacillus alba]MEC0231768.1 SRPBCC domain-containing protein [Paenibacillus alba]NQX70372.1 SRPBCC domain-containing protein [Paenibacillus alba]
MSLTLSLDFQYTTSIEKLWSALTDSSKLAKWVMENDFKPVVGHRFQFRTQPTEWWNGIIDGEVLIVDPPNELSYTMVSGDKLTATWTLQDLGDGKVNLHLEQTGFSNTQGLEGARYGVSKWCSELEKLLEQ